MLAAEPSQFCRGRYYGEVKLKPAKATSSLEKLPTSCLVKIVQKKSQSSLTVGKNGNECGPDIPSW